jgi:putative lipoic acid-binding regulatory protein
MNSYELSRNWFNYCFENPERIKPNHSALFFFAIEHCNRLGWKEKFGFPSQMVMEALGIKNWRTYSKTLNELEDFGFIKIIERSKNQYSSNIIAIVKNAKADTKALDKALQKHSTKQGQSIVSIIKQYNKEQLTHLKSEVEKLIKKFDVIDSKKYTEQDFLINWNEARKWKTKQPSNLNNLRPNEKDLFWNASQEYTKEQFKEAIMGLFSQERIPIEIMWFRPKHFLENIDTYLDAKQHNNTTLYKNV